MVAVICREALGKLDVSAVVLLIQLEVILAEAVLVVPLGTEDESEGKENEEDDHHGGDCGGACRRRTFDLVVLAIWMCCCSAVNVAAAVSILGGAHSEIFCRVS